MSNEKMRAEFEAKAGIDPKWFEYRDGDGYSMDKIQHDWALWQKAWQAARAQPVCQHRIADARNPVVKSGYLCVDCGALFSAADHDGHAQPAGEAVAYKAGRHAIRYRDNWDGEGDIYHLIAILHEDGSWTEDETGKKLLEYEGDEILQAWPLLTAQPAQPAPVAGEAVALWRDALEQISEWTDDERAKRAAQTALGGIECPCCDGFNGGCEECSGLGKRGEFESLRKIAQAAHAAAHKLGLPAGFDVTKLPDVITAPPAQPAPVAGEAVAIVKYQSGGNVVHIVGDVKPGDLLFKAPPAQVPDAMEFTFRHPKHGDEITVELTREEIADRMGEELFSKLCATFCHCEPVGETNVVECNCSEYGDEFELVTAAPQPMQQPAQVPDAEPSESWWNDLIADISAIDCMYRGSPTYEHDAYYMRDRVIKMLEARRNAAAPQPKVGGRQPCTWHNFAKPKGGE